MSSQTIYDFVEGDTLPEPTYQFASLALYSEVRLEVKREDGFCLPDRILDVAAYPAAGNTVNAAIDDIDLGIIRFTWNTGELVTGHHTARLVLVRAVDNKEESLPKGLPILIRVADKEDG